MKMVWALQDDQLLHANISMPSVGLYATHLRVLHGVFQPSPPVLHLT